MRRFLNLFSRRNPETASVTQAPEAGWVAITAQAPDTAQVAPDPIPTIAHIAPILVPASNIYFVPSTRNRPATGSHLGEEDFKNAGNTLEFFSRMLRQDPIINKETIEIIDKGINPEANIIKGLTPLHLITMSAVTTNSPDSTKFSPKALETFIQGGLTPKDINQPSALDAGSLTALDYLHMRYPETETATLMRPILRGVNAKNASTYPPIQTPPHYSANRPNFTPVTEGYTGFTAKRHPWLLYEKELEHAENTIKFFSKMLVPNPVIDGETLEIIAKGVNPSASIIKGLTPLHLIAMSAAIPNSAAALEIFIKGGVTLEDIHRLSAPEIGSFTALDYLDLHQTQPEAIKMKQLLEQTNKTLRDQVPPPVATQVAIATPIGNNELYLPFPNNENYR